MCKIVLVFITLLLENSRQMLWQIFLEIHNGEKERDLMDEAGGSKNHWFFSPLHICDHYSDVVLNLPCAFYCARKQSYGSLLPLLPLQLKGKKTERPKVSGRNELKIWMKTDTDGWSGLRCFLKTALILGSKPPTVLPPTDIQPAAGG